MSESSLTAPTAQLLETDPLRSIARDWGFERTASLDPGARVVDPTTLYHCADVLGAGDLSQAVSLLCSVASLPIACMVAIGIDLAFDPTAKTARALLSLSAWRRLIELAGYEIIREHAFDAAPAASWQPTDRLKQYWQDANLFGQDGAADMRLLLCRRSPTRINVTDLARILEDLLDVVFVQTKKDRFAARLHRPVVLNIHQFQDYLNLLPIIDLLDPGQVTPLIREHAECRYLKRLAIGADLRRRGFLPRFYRSVDELDWSGLAGQPVLSASESSATTGHALSRQMVEVATTRGCPTFLLQHGIWLEAFAGGPIGFGSQRILSWGREHADSLATLETGWMGTAMPRGAVPGNRFQITGSPKYADALAPGGKNSLEIRLGIRPGRFSGTTLIGTSLHWGRHTDTTSFIESIKRLSRARPDDLFILKAHPAEDFFQYESLRDDNVMVYDDILALAIGYQIPRLLKGVDRVASSLSSLLVDGAVLDLPVFQYDTGNTLSYSGINHVNDLDTILDDGSRQSGLQSAQALASTYAEADHEGFYTRLADEFDSAMVTTAQEDAAMQQVGAYGLVEQITLEHQKAVLRVDDVEVLLASGLFDADHYRKVAGDLDGLSPIEHFLTRGGWRGLDPRISFDSNWYLEQHPLLRSCGMLPVMHYIRTGSKEGLDPHVLFRDSWYRRQVGDRVMSGTALADYLLLGEAAGMSSHPFFDAGYYRKSLTGDVGGSLLEHFIASVDHPFGDPSSSFSITEYLASSPDLLGSGINPLVHYLKAGAKEGRRRSSLQRL